MKQDKEQSYKIATRGSQLALWQTQHVQKLLKELGVHSEVNIIKTKGDLIQNRFLHEIGGKGLFVKELEQAMLEGQADLAVHSLKDLPAKTPQGFVLAAILKRHSARDVVILNESSKIPLSNTLLSPKEVSDLGGITLATASLRRQSLLKSISKSISLKPVRGNVDTRIRKLKESDWDGIVLAKAALDRLSLTDIPNRVLDPHWFTSSPAQGALAIECREDHPIREVLEHLDDKESRLAVTIERKVLEELGGDCTMPIGCYISEEPDGAYGHCKVLDYDGKLAETKKRLSDRILDLDVDSSVNSILSGLRDQHLSEILERLKSDPPNLGEL